MVAHGFQPWVSEAKKCRKCLENNGSLLPQACAEPGELFVSAIAIPQLLYHYRVRAGLQRLRENTFSVSIKIKKGLLLSPARDDAFLVLSPGEQKPALLSVMHRPNHFLTRISFWE